MTSAEQEIFFELLRASIWQREVNLKVFQTSFSWSNICRSLESHALLALAADAILNINEKLPSDCQLTQIQVMAIMQHCATVAQTHFDLNNAIVKSFQFLENSGCHPILLKGQGLATLYPIRNARSCGDIDIYINPSEYEKACEAIKQLINNPQAVETAEEAAHHYEIHDGKIIYEIHRYPSVAGNQSYQDKYYALSSTYLKPEKCNTIIIDNSVLSDQNLHAVSVQIPVPCTQYNVLYVFNHLCQHLWEGGVGLKQIIDWMMLLSTALSKKELDLAILKSDLQTIGLYRAWRILAGVLVYQLGFPKERFPFWNEHLAQKSQGYYIDELIGGASFGSKTSKDQSYKSFTGIKRKVKALKYYYCLCRPVSIISNRFAIERFIFFLKETILRPGRN